MLNRHLNMVSRHKIGMLVHKDHKQQLILPVLRFLQYLFTVWHIAIVSIDASMQVARARWKALSLGSFFLVLQNFAKVL